MHCLDRLDGDGMVWVWMQSMRVHASAGLNQSLIQEEYRVDWVGTWVQCVACRAAACVVVSMHALYVRTVDSMRQAQTNVPSPSEMRSPILDIDRDCEIAITVRPGQGHGHLEGGARSLGARSSRDRTAAYTTSPPVYYLLASVIGEFAGAIPHPSGYMPAWPPAWLLHFHFSRPHRATLRNKWPLLPRS